MKSNKYCKEENIIFFLLVLFGLFICVLFICDLIQDSKRIENPSIELIEKVEKKYLNGNLVDDFKVDDSIFNKPTADGEEDCDIYWKNSQNIIQHQFSTLQQVQATLQYKQHKLFSLQLSSEWISLRE